MFQIQTYQLNLPVWKQLSLAFLISTICCLVFFGKTVSFDLIYLDDINFFINRADLYVKDTLFQSLVSIWTTLPREEPLLVRDTVWSVAAYHLGIDNYGAFHFIQIVFHSLGNFCLYVWLYLLTKNVRFAAIPALLHSFAPYNVETVSWIADFKGVFSTFWILLTFVLFTLWLQTTSSRKYLFYSLSVVTTFLAMLSKQNAFVIPPILILLTLQANGFFDHPSKTSIRNLVNRKRLMSLCPSIPHFVICITLVLWTLEMSATVTVFGAHKATNFIDFIPKILTFTPLLFVKYLHLIFLKTDYFFYLDWPLNDTPITGSLVLASLLVYFALAAVLIWSWKKNPTVLFWLLTYLVFIFPYLEWIRDLVWISNRYLYLSGIAVLAIFAFFIERGLQQKALIWRWLSAAILLVFLGFNAVRTIKFVPVFEDAMSFWSNEYIHNPKRPVVALGLASAYTKKLENPFILAPERAVFRREYHQIMDAFIVETDLLNKKSEDLSDHRSQSMVLFYLAGIAINREEPHERITSYFERSLEWYGLNASVHIEYGNYLLGTAQKQIDPDKQYELTAKAFNHHMAGISVPGFDSLRNSNLTPQVIMNRYNRLFPGFVEKYARESQKGSSKSDSSSPPEDPSRPENNQE